MNNRPELGNYVVILVSLTTRLIAIFPTKSMLAILRFFSIICHSLIMCDIFFSIICALYSFAENGLNIR